MINKNRKEPTPAAALQSRSIRRNRKKGAVSRGSKKGTRWFGPAAALFGLILLSLCFVGGYIGITRCDILGVTDISVSGAYRLEEQDIIRQARVVPGDNILAVNLQATRRHLLGHPWIASARVSRRLPGTIILEIREYSPLAVVDLGQLYFVDENRKLFKLLSDSDPVTLPLITGFDYRDLDAAGRPGSDLMRAALDMVETGNHLRHLLPGMAMRRVSVDRDMGITIHAFNHIDRVRLGFDADNDQYAKKFRRLKDLLGRLAHGAGSMPMAAVNLEFPDRVVVKPEAGIAVSGNFHKGG